MTAKSGSRRLVLVAALAAALLAAGCATPPPQVDSYTPPPLGSTWAYRVTESGSYGTGNRQLVLRMGEATWEGRKVLSFQNPNQHMLQDERLALLAILSPAGELQMRYDPPIGWQWPLVVGKSWSQDHVLTLVAAGGRRIPFKADWTVQAYEDVMVPAGTFKAWRLVYQDSFSETQTIWFVPGTMGIFVKRLYERPASFPQGGAGTRLLELVRVPSAN